MNGSGLRTRHTGRNEKLLRMVKVTDNGKVIYRSGKSQCLCFPEQGDEQLKAGTLRNFQVVEPLEFLAEVTQHIPEKRQHQILS